MGFQKSGRTYLNGISKKAAAPLLVLNFLPKRSRTYLNGISKKWLDLP